SPSLRARQFLRYRICGLSFESAEPFPELTISPQTASDDTVQLRRVESLPNAGQFIRPAVAWTLPDGTPTLTSIKTEGGYLLEFIDLAEFFIDNEGRSVLYQPRPGIPAHSIRHLILDSVMALVLSLRGCAVLHASAVVTPLGACAFAASTGVGKSTLAASFQRLNYPILTDDCLLLESDGAEIYGVPSYPNARLRGDSLDLIRTRFDRTLPVAHYNSKRRVKNGGFAVGRHRLARLYFLERNGAGATGREPMIEPVSGVERLMLALRFMFCLDPHDPAMLVRQFRQLEQLLASVPVAKLIIPNDFAALPRVQAVVLDDLKARSEAAVSHSG
ncbi:MAG TPA: hypothetical protein VMT64_12415, partial [Candidatus Binataceae bacterium]|nr:hypothetical protein [Candidatus Binataceae bacterium]